MAEDAASAPCLTRRPSIPGANAAPTDTVIAFRCAPLPHYTPAINHRGMGSLLKQHCAMPSGRSEAGGSLELVARFPNRPPVVIEHPDPTRAQGLLRCPGAHAEGLARRHQLAVVVPRHAWACHWLSRRSFRRERDGRLRKVNLVMPELTPYRMAGSSSCRRSSIARWMP